MKKKYQPQDTMMCVELRQQLNSMSMRKTEDPAMLFEKIAMIENKYTGPRKVIEPEDLIPVVLDAAPDMYGAILTSEQRHQGDQLQLDDLETVMTQHYQHPWTLI